MTTAIKTGQVYLVDSQRKGKFTGRLTAVDDTWATFTITAGRAAAMLAYNERKVGEEVTVRREWCAFTHVPEKGLPVRICEGCSKGMPKKKRPQACPACGHVHERIPNPTTTQP